MDKVKCVWRNLSLRKSIIAYVAVFAAVAVILCMLTSFLCDNAVSNIYNSYPSPGEKYYLTNEKGERLGEGTYISAREIEYSEKDRRSIAVLESIPVITTPVYSALCIIAAAMLFYRNKIKKPLSILTAASGKIAENDLDFIIDYDSKDELGQLCNSFEIMRSALADNLSDMWRQMEERKQLNAAFAHDLRTPLTILKGYDEMLRDSSDENTKATALTMEKHITRLERYADSMSSLQRMEDMKPEYNPVFSEELVSALSECADILCQKSGKKLYLQSKLMSKKVFADVELITEVNNNLISNAVRYAEANVTLCLNEAAGGLMLSVSDDGRGFSESSLHKAVNPYFTEENNRFEHFGLGLYICKILCERHGGYLKLENLDPGAKVTAFFKFPKV